MEYINQTREPDRINYAVSITLDIRHYLEHAGATETPEWLGLRVF